MPSGSQHSMARTPEPEGPANDYIVVASAPASAPANSITVATTLGNPPRKKKQRQPGTTRWHRTRLLAHDHPLPSDTPEFEVKDTIVVAQPSNHVGPLPLRRPLFVAKGASTVRPVGTTKKRSKALKEATTQSPKQPNDQERRNTTAERTLIPETELGLATS